MSRFLAQVSASLKEYAFLLNRCVLELGRCSNDRHHRNLHVRGFGEFDVIVEVSIYLIVFDSVSKWPD